MVGENVKERKYDGVSKSLPYVVCSPKGYDIKQTF